MTHSTARVLFDWSPRRERREATIPLPSSGQGALDLRARRVAFDRDAGGLYIDGGRWCLPAGAAPGEFDCHGEVDDPVPPFTPVWLVELVRGVTSRVGRGKPRPAGAETWTRYHCVCSWEEADALAPIRLAMPHSFRGVWRVAIAVWLDEEGRLRRVWARSIGLEVNCTLRDFDSLPPIEPLGAQQGGGP